jgi:hypothetical protein
MLISTCDQVSDPRDTVASADGDAELRQTIAVLEGPMVQVVDADPPAKNPPVHTRGS